MEIKISSLAREIDTSLNDLYNITKDSVVHISTEYQPMDPSNGSYYSTDNTTY